MEKMLVKIIKTVDWVYRIEFHGICHAISQDPSNIAWDFSKHDIVPIIWVLVEDEIIYLCTFIKLLSTCNHEAMALVPVVL